MARPSGQDFPKHKGELFGNIGIPSLSGFPKFPKFPKWPDLVDRIFQNIRANFVEISEMEIRKGRGENFGNFGIEFGRADRHQSDDRPGATTFFRGHGLSTVGGGDHTYICIQTHIHTYIHADRHTDRHISMMITSSRRRLFLSWLEG